MNEELENYNYPLADVSVYAGNQHYFFSIDPVDLDIDLGRISVVIFRISIDLDLLSLIAYRLFLRSLTEEYNNPKYDSIFSKVVTNDIYEIVDNEIRNMPSIRTMIHSVQYYRDEDYYEYELMYSY